jgi:hypothetical protein
MSGFRADTDVKLQRTFDIHRNKKQTCPLGAGLHPKAQV